MAPKSCKRKAEDKLSSPQPTRRQRSQTTKPTEDEAQPVSSTPRQPSSTPSSLSYASPTTSSTTSSQTEDDAEEEVERLVCRIKTCIEYVLEQQRRGEAIQQITRFEINLSEASTQPTLDLLRHYATLVSSSPRFETFELGVPRPDWVKEGHFPGIHDPQWWIGRTAAEIKAGPLADEYDVRSAAATMKGVQTRRERKRDRTSREEEMAWKLEEGLRRQKARLGLEDDEEDGDESLESGDDAEDYDEEEEEQGEYEDRSVAAVVRKRKRPVVEDSEDEEEEGEQTGFSAPAPRKRKRAIIEESDDEE